MLGLNYTEKHLQDTMQVTLKCNLSSRKVTLCIFLCTLLNEQTILENKHFPLILKFITAVYACTCSFSSAIFILSVGNDSKLFAATFFKAIGK